MANTTRTTTGVVFSATVMLLLSACITTLAPNYDKAIVDGLVTTNQKLMEFFASTAAGTTKESFAERRKTYNGLIGSMDALVIQAKARPIPKNKITQRVNEVLEKRGIQVLEDDDAPSATALEKISATMVKMRDTDKKQGVTAFEVLAFRGQVVIYLDQAITYESFLER